MTKNIGITLLLLLLTTTSLLLPKNALAQYCGTTGSSNCPPGVTCGGSSVCSAGDTCIVGGAAPFATCGGRNNAESSQAQSAMTGFIAKNYEFGPNSGFALTTAHTLTTGLIAPQYGGGVAQAGSAMMAMYTHKPASVSTAIADMKRNLGLPVKTAYAQTTGFGFDSLNPIIPLWRISRNIALAGFVIIFVVIGLMIMLRKQIDARTVVTIQQSLPKMVIALLLVIFSYALAGLLIDITTVISRTGLWILQSNGLIAQGNTNFRTDAWGNTNNDTNLDAAENYEALLRRNIFGLFEPLYNADELLSQITNIGGAGGINSDQLGQLDNIVSIFKLAGFGTFSGGVLGAVIWIAIFVTMLRTFFMLLTNYIAVIFKIIFAPFTFLLSAIPGSHTSAEGWVIGMMKHLLVFPVVFFMLCFSAIFRANSGTDLWTNQGSTANPNYYNIGPAVGGNLDGVFPVGVNFWGPAALGGWNQVLGPLLSLGIILTIPRVATAVGKALDQRHQPGASDGAAGEALMGAARRIPFLRTFT